MAVFCGQRPDELGLGADLHAAGRVSKEGKGSKEGASIRDVLRAAAGRSGGWAFIIPIRRLIRWSVMMNCWQF